MKRAAQGGFTLIELVLAVALLAAMLGMAWSGLSFALRSWDVGAGSGHRAADARLSENFLRRELMQVFPMRWKDPRQLKFAFEGEKDRLRFVSARPPDVTGGGLSLVALDVEAGPEAGSKRLLMRRAPPDDEAKDFSPLDAADPIVLLSDLREIQFEYFGSEGDVNDPRWLDAWAAPGRIPLLVRVRTTALDGTAKPDLVVRLMLGEEAGCIENLFQRACRARRPT
jgi:general secretion pathway protein J